MAVEIAELGITRVGTGICAVFGPLDFAIFAYQIIKAAQVEDAVNDYFISNDPEPQYPK